MKSRIAFAVLAASLCAACHGPKDDCEGTMRSMEAIIDGNSWDDYPELIYPPMRNKFGDRKITAWVAENYQGCTSFKFTQLDPSVSKDTCFAVTQSHWRQKIRGHEPEVFDDSYTYTLHQLNGKWYVELPGTAKLQAF